MKIFRFLVLFILISVMGCKNKTLLNDKGIPQTLVIAIFSGDDPQETGDKLIAVKKYLEGKLKIKVEFVQTTDYTGVIEALRSKKVHMAYLSPFSYVLACRKVDLQPLVNIGLEGKPRSYRSVIVTNKHTGLKSMKDVKLRSKDLTLCFTDPASTSGHLIPASYLRSINLDPKNSFKQKLFASSHSASVMTVLAGKVDIGCAWDLALPLLKEKGITQEGDLIVLWQSDPIVSDPIVIRKDISKEFRELVLQTYLAMPKEAPVAFNNLVKLYYTETKGLEYMIAYDSMYNGIRKIAAVEEVNIFQ